MTYDPREHGADCDRCPLGPNGCLRDGPWRPVKPELREGSTVLGILEAPKQDDQQYGRPLAGPDGGEWSRSLAAVGLKRTHIDLAHVVACRPPGAKAPWKKLDATIKRQRKKIAKDYKRAGAKASKAKEMAAKEAPHPVECCRQHMLRIASKYQYILPLGTTPSQKLLETTNSMSRLEGDMIERKASRLFWDAFDWTQVDYDWTVKVVPTFDPGYIKHAPKFRPQFTATLGKALRWFNDALLWREPEVLSQPAPQQLREWLSVAAPFWVYDYETDGINVRDISIDCLSIATPDMDVDGNPTMPWETPHQVARVVGIHLDMDLNRRAVPSQRVREYGPEELAEIKEIIVEFLTDPAKLKVGHNEGYFDRQVSEHYFGVRPQPSHDTLFDTRFTHPDLPKGLKPTGRRITDVHKWETSESGEGTATSRLTVKDRLVYCQFDTVVNARIKEPLHRSADENGAARPLPDWAKPVDWPSARPWDLRNLDHARQDLCVQMHQNGVYVDQALVKTLTEKFEKVSVDLNGDLQELAARVGLKKLDMGSVEADDDVVNPRSFDQIRNLLYEDWDLGCPYGMDAKDFYTQSGLPGTGDAVLRAHMSNPELSKDQFNFLMKLRQYRRVVVKVLGTQLRSLTPLGLTKKGRLHPDSRIRSNWNSHTTAVGRFSSSGPNMQNQSSRKDLGGVRKVYCAAPGNVLVGCDLSAAHLVITANYWQIERLLDCFDQNLDPHCWLAHDLFGKDFENASGWTKGFSLKATHKPSKKGKAGQLRELTKTYRYASIYWAGAETKHSVIRSTEMTGFNEKGKLETSLPYLKFDLRQVRYFDQVWHESEPDWKRAWQSMLDLYEQQGFMEDPLFGRRSGSLQEGKKNEVVNYPVLSCESAIMSIAEMRVLRSFPSGKWGPGTGITAQVHDSLVVEVPEHLAEWAQKEMTRLMTIKVPGWPVPFTCEADVGRTWAEV
ncbi:MAG: DNA polymerase [Planctomycetota bacterium]|nr:DNA polymerase [Planctomycetota bacterium]